MTPNHGDTKGVFFGAFGQGVSDTLVGKEPSEAGYHKLTRGIQTPVLPGSVQPETNLYK